MRRWFRILALGGAVALAQASSQWVQAAQQSQGTEPFGGTDPLQADPTPAAPSPNTPAAVAPAPESTPAEPARPAQARPAGRDDTPTTSAPRRTPALESEPAETMQPSESAAPSPAAGPQPGLPAQSMPSPGALPPPQDSNPSGIARRPGGTAAPGAAAMQGSAAQAPGQQAGFQGKVSANSGCPQGSSDPIRRRPGQPVPSRLELEVECDPTRLPTPNMVDAPAAAPVNRWNIIDALGYRQNWRDPYDTNNSLKGDRPIRGTDDYSVVTVTSNSLLESRRVPAVAAPDAAHPAGAQQSFLSETLTLDAVAYKGDTIFKPPDYQFRFTPILNYANTRTNGNQVTASTLGAQALFAEKHLRDVSANYDFDSIRVGVQPVISDFRGFILSDQPVGIRLFGTRDSDVYQYNIGWFRRLPKNANRQNALFGGSGGFPNNDLAVANLYVQDLGRPGTTSELIFIYDRSRVPGTLVTPSLVAGTAAKFTAGARHDYDVAYLGYSFDGHLGRYNLTGSLYEALGREAQTMFGAMTSRVMATFAAAELSRDFDWIRVRGSMLYSSGDANPMSNSSRGFDGISQSALFAGADSSFFIHQKLPLVLNQIDLKERDALFDDLRSATDAGESNYKNPGLRLVGLGADFDVSPMLRISVDANHLWFDQTATLQVITGRAAIARNIGTDFALDAIYRPFDSQNIIVRVSAAKLFATGTAQQLTGGTSPFSMFGNIVLTY